MPARGWPARRVSSRQENAGPAEKYDLERMPNHTPRHNRSPRTTVPESVLVMCGVLRQYAPSLKRMYSSGLGLEMTVLRFRTSATESL
jgi:hypothetical protein